MPISPTPPSGANTSSPCGAGHRQPASPPCSTSPAATACIVPSARRRTKRPRLVDGLELARRARRPAAPRGSACRGPRRARASRRGSRQSPRRGPIARAARPSRADSAANSVLGRRADAGGGEIGRGKVGAGRVMRAVDADADRRPRRPRLRSGCRRTCCGRSADRSAISARAASPAPECARRRRRAAPAPRRTTARRRASGGDGSVSSRLA